MSQSTDPSASRAETTAQISHHVAEIIRLLGEDTDRDGLRRTPHRVAEALQFLTRGYGMSAGGILSSALFEQQYSEMILVKDIELFSLCEHHMLPFFGKAHIAYMPQDRIVGLSKLARVVDVFAQRLQVQERLTVQIAEAIQKELSPMGVGVVIEATHLCMVMRGVQKQNSVTCTSSMLGEFLTNSKTRAEFMRLIK